MCQKYTISYKCVDCGKGYHTLPEKEIICDDAIGKGHTCKTWTKKTHKIDSGRCDTCMNRAGCVMRPAGETGRKNVTRLVTQPDNAGDPSRPSDVDVHGRDVERVETESNYGLYN